jgi:RND family efflux transporter MFP subunit
MSEAGDQGAMRKNRIPVDGPVIAQKSSPGIAEELRSLRLGDAERRRPARQRRLRFGSWVFFAILTSAASAGAYWWLTRGPSGEWMDAVIFSTESKAETLLDKTGYIVPHNRITLSPEVGGIITKIHVEEGSRVKRGMVLIELDDARFKAEWEQTRATLAAAEAQWNELKAGSRPEEIQEARATLEQTQARIAFLRAEVKRIYDSGVGFAASRAEYEKNMGSLREGEATERSQKAHLKLVELGPRKEKIHAAEAEVMRARAIMDKARFYYDRTRITSPCDGVVLERKVEIGEAVHPEVLVGTLCVLADLTDLEAEAEIPERDLDLLKDAGECQVLPDAYPGRMYRAKFNRLQPLVNRQRGVVKVKVTILNPDDVLLPDMNCRILFPRPVGRPSEAVFERANELGRPSYPVLPEEAIVHEGQTTVVYVFDGQAARRRVLDCGRTIGSNIEVRNGLRQGDVVLLPGAKPLHDGDPVRPRFKTSSLAVKRGE